MQNAFCSRGKTKEQRERAMADRQGGLKVVKAAASRQRGSGGEWQVTDKRYKGMQSNKAKKPPGNGAQEQKN